jgi:aspartate-semialdehyde dehydrogenase
VLRHYGKIAGENAPLPSVMMLQAPTFHGHALAVYLEMEKPADLPALSQAVAGEHVTVASPEDSSPSNVSSAGQADILVSVKNDPAQSNGVWIWAVADNLRISALTSVECAESMAAARPTGKIQ